MTHRPGTVAGCAECRWAAYEPSWYAAMVAFDPEVANADHPLERMLVA